METESRRKRSPSDDSDESRRRRSRKYDRSPSPRRSRYRRSRSRDRRSRSSSRDRRRKESNRSQEWNKAPPAPQTQPAASTTTPAGYVPPQVQYQAPPPPNTSQPPPQMGAYGQGYNNYSYNYGQGYEYTYQQPPGYRSGYPPANWPGNQVPYNNQQAPPPPTLSTPQDTSRSIEPVPPGMVPPTLPRPEDAKKEAIAAEVKQQKATLAKQREEYVKKSATLQRELEILRQQCDEIGKEGGRENNRIIKENQKLQVEIQNKMKSIHNVIDMLSGIIGDKVTVDDLKNKFKPDSNKRTKSPKEEFPSEKTETPEKVISLEPDREVKAIKDDKPAYNFVHYDPEMHWCKVCDIFPKTAKEYLNHLHSNEHKETCLERKIVDMPWHEHTGNGSEKEVPYYPGLPTKRTPIKGLQFFSPATAWYCKLCDAWIGDLHCASLHLKSKRHSENFSRFVEQNPHWETDWMADREKAFSEEKHKQIQLELQKQKEDELPLPPASKPKKAKKSKKKSKKSKKRKAKSSNSDTTSDSENTDSESDQDNSKSIRVAMRNKMKASTQAILNEEIEYPGLKLKGPWAQVAQQMKVANLENHGPESDDRQLLNSIRDKLKAKQEEEIKSMNSKKVHGFIEKSIQESEREQIPYQKKEDELAAWGPKEPPKPFWIKKDEDKNQSANKPIDIPEPKEIPKPHMGFWTKQQVNMPIKPESKSSEKEDDRDRERERYKDERDRKYDRRDEKYDRYDDKKYDRRRSGRDRDRERDRDRDRDRDYYEDRRKRERDSGESPRRERGWRESPKRNFDKYKDRREDINPNDESKFEKKTNEAASKLKKNSTPAKKPNNSLSKGKLPFIGRLPLFKKKIEEPKLPEKEPAPLPYTQSKFENTPKVPSEIINPPGVVHITKLATPVNLNNTVNRTSQMKILVAPPPPVLKETKLTQQVVDMEIEDQSEEVVIEQPIIYQQKETAKIPVPTSLPPMTQPPPTFVNQVPQNDKTHFAPNRPPPGYNPPPFTQNPPPRFQVRPPFVQNHQPQIPPSVAYPNPPPPLGEALVPDVSEIPEPSDKRPEHSNPLPEDLQEALNIIFPKDEGSEPKPIPQENTIMYASMYSMLGCVGYGPEYMDQPPPEITQPEQEAEAQPGPDDLRMLGIDEGDCVL